MPDTGQDNCYDGSALVTCSTANSRDSAKYPAQDGRFGRDAAAAKGQLPKTGAGDAGFDYTKICNNGKKAGETNCPVNPVLGLNDDNWACTLDNVTGLIWEVKTNDTIPALRDKTWRYSWYSQDSTVNGGNVGGLDTANNCFDGDRCDTEKYIADVNASNLCGNNDWRLPGIRELHSITNVGSQNPAIDKSYFPNNVTTGFWSASTSSSTPAQAWLIQFGTGTDGKEPKTASYQIRLVRGGQL